MQAFRKGDGVNAVSNVTSISTAAAGGSVRPRALPSL